MLLVQGDFEKGRILDYKKEKQFELSMEKARRILDDDFFPHESTPQAYWVRSQSIPNKKYLVNWYHTDFIVCECPWFICGNICKHAINVNWLYFNSSNSEPLCHQDAMANTFNDPPEISIEPQNCDENADMTLIPTDIVDADVEELHMAREEVFRKLQFLLNNPPITLCKMNQLNGLLDNFLDDDFDFTPSLGALDSSLKRKKRFLSRAKRKTRSKQNSGLEIDLNVHASEYEPFEFRYLNKQGHPRSNNAFFMDPG